MVTDMDANKSRAVAHDPAAGLRRQLRFSTAMFFASTLYPSARPWLATAVAVRLLLDIFADLANDYDPEES